MHRALWAIVATLCLTFSAPAGARGLENLKAGVTGVLEFPADPVVHVISPPEDLANLPMGQVTGRVLGVFTGTGLGLYRALMGVTDIVLSPLWIMPVMSPPARWEIFD